MGLVKIKLLSNFGQKMMKYIIKETSSVTDEELEKIINEGVAQGYLFQGIQFAMRESSRRPAMAFISFTNEEEE